MTETDEIIMLVMSIQNKNLLHKCRLYLGLFTLAILLHVYFFSATSNGVVNPQL